ncbi:unnamed protein product [Dimorphilus gyrociliatus]|uniref:Elongation of very long chain fatty acids protein n=1 Tax=Dimorphilus gyrociliatus TaxID=2664684 RepID=A0A7I8VPB5_9ANNE|nr:unnamed protein product [Dimorphilus gyrociliatus]
MTDKTSDFSFSYVFPFEKNFDEESFWQWIRENWTLSLWYSLAYIVFIFGGKYYMERRPRLEIRVALAVWSSILAIFSILGAMRTMPELIYVINKYGWEFSVCNPSYVYYSPTAFWTCLFALSKVYELGDTIFIVLRKQQLIFLHWYHHITVLIYVWYSIPEHTAPGRWFIVMNYTVHSFMYTYYALKAMRVKVPKFISMVITSLQITQMIIGVAVNIWAYHVKGKGGYCQQSYSNLKWSSIMYLSYFALFSNFFYHAYFNKKKPSVQDIKKMENKKQN